MIKLYRIIIAIVCLYSVFTGSAFSQTVSTKNIPNLMSSEEVSRLLTTPACMKSFNRSDTTYSIEYINIPSNGISLYGRLFLPKSSGKYPLIVFIHGGHNNLELLNSAPLYYAPRLAHCGYAALVYDKRGTGKSGGVFHESTYDDFITDIGNAAVYLSKHKAINPERIGVYGGSQGGRFAPLAAARFDIISFAISASGPIGTIEENWNYNIKNALKIRGNPDSTIDAVMPYWLRHHAAWANNDTLEFNALAKEIIKLREKYDPFIIPSTYEEIITDSNLFMFRAGFNSISRDYLSELKNFRKKWLCIYGELDEQVNAQASIKNLTACMEASKNENYSIILFRGHEHSFRNVKTGDQEPIINIIVNWFNENVGS
ncbi:MAG: prolyl oligopeptidase family serine peptidase [candidate division Zixibacteria bacterium]|nr:prolyl oligopeptidase family serine peptidase [candidate division Zixibacteria bacterium]